jgi:hypothetical protein
MRQKELDSIYCTHSSLDIEKGHCKNCGDQIGDDSNPYEFCSDQCGVEYQLEHKK